MRFIHPNCPKCGARAVSLLGHVLTAMPLVTDSVNGEPGYEYGCSSEIEWNTETPVESDLEEVQLTCGKRHMWWTLESPDTPPTEIKPEPLFSEGDSP
jgi:hypothetical protein